MSSRRRCSRRTAPATGGPSDVPEGRVLVVGGGNTGFQIAKELSTSHTVELAVGSRQTPLPQKLLGRDLFWWLTKTRAAATRRSSRGSGGALPKPRHADRLEPARADAALSASTIKPRVVDASGRKISFADGSEHEVDAVIWATGYRPDHSWIDLPVVRCRRPPAPPPRRDRRSRPLLPRSVVAAHARLGAARLGQRRRRVHRQQDRRQGAGRDRCRQRLAHPRNRRAAGRERKERSDHEDAHARATSTSDANFPTDHAGLPEARR